MDNLDAIEARPITALKIAQDIKEIDNNKTSDVFVFVGKNEEGFIEDFKKQGFIDNKIISNELPYVLEENLLDRVELANSGNGEEGN